MINTLTTGINSIYTNSASSILSKIGNANQSDETSAANLFKSAFESAASALRDVDELQSASDTATMNFITGEDDNIHSVLLAQEKALISLQFTSEVTNNALEAYNEIMRMSI